MERESERERLTERERERENNSTVTHLYWVKFGRPALMMKILGNCISLSLISYNTSSLLTKGLHVISFTFYVVQFNH